MKPLIGIEFSCANVRDRFEVHRESQRIFFATQALRIGLSRILSSNFVGGFSEPLNSAIPRDLEEPCVRSDNTQRSLLKLSGLVQRAGFICRMIIPS